MADLGNQESVQQITETLFQTFGQQFSKEVIAAIIENCYGNANISANAIINMIDDMNKEDDKKKQELPHNMDKNSKDQEATCKNDNLEQTSKDNRSKSYAGSLAQPVTKYTSTGARPKTSNSNDFRSTQKKSFTKKEDQWITPQIKNIILQHNQGSKILIMMRGLPGSGKSYLAKKIVAKTIGCDFEKHILSTDDFFFRNGTYHFEKFNLQIAHTWNQNRAENYMATGRSPIIIDNTNISAWELEPYVRSGVQYGYLVEVVEPNTAWAWKPKDLVKRNIHNVPLQSIENMQNRYDDKINSNNVIELFKLSYPHKILPPDHRNIAHPIESVSGQLKKINLCEEGKEIHSHSDNAIPSTSKKEINFEDLSSDNVIVQSRDIASKEPLVANNIDTNSDYVFEKCSEKERQIQEFTKVEQDWERGESWNDDCQTTAVKSAEHDVDNSIKTAKPQRKCKNRQSKSYFSSLRFDDEKEIMKSTDTVSDNSFLGNSKSEIETKGLIPNTENFLNVKSAEHDVDNSTKTAKPQRKCKNRQSKSYFSSLRFDDEKEMMKSSDTVSENSCLGNSKSEIEAKGLIPNTENFLKVKSAEHDVDNSIKTAKPQRKCKNRQSKSYFSSLRFDDEKEMMKSSDTVSDNSCLGNSKSEIEAKGLIPNTENFLNVKSAEHDVDNSIKTAKPQRKCKNGQSKSHFSSLRFGDEKEMMKSSDIVSENSCLGNLKSEIETEGLLPNTENSWKECQDWTKFSLFMPPWENTSKSDNSKPTIVVEKVDSSTCVESQDTDIKNTNKPYKVLETFPKDINLLYVPVDKEKIPEKRMLDKSSMTNEEMLTKTIRCKYENSHFKQLAKMYYFIEEAVLRDIFDRCHGDVNWTQAILAEELRNKQIPLKTNTDDLSLSDDDDEIPEGGCSCLAAYGLSPNINPVHSGSTNSSSAEEKTSERTPLKRKKSKKYVKFSESSIKLKRELEKNVVIADSHYSENFLKLRRLRRGELKKAKIEGDNTKTTVDNEIPSTSKVDIEASSSCSEAKDKAESEVVDKLDDDYEEKYVELCVGKECVARLDKLCGRQSSEYPSDIEPKIIVPVSIFSDSNFMWVESVCHQLDQTPKQTDLMIKQDEEFARKLAEKEAEMAQAGMEPEVPDLKEIMDMELALSLYQKDVEAEWRSKEPSDLAAKLSRQKLFNLFPEISPNVLSELLMALDNNFYATLESLLLSTGLGDVLETKGGVNKYVMEKELERQKKIIQEQKRALSEFEWPLLPKTGNVEMSAVDDCRRDADMHMKRRTMIYQKAQDYFNRGMTQVASFYAELAEIHTRKYEYSNCLAAAYLIQVHASSNRENTSIDLHNLRVSEALEGLDLFLDSHIQSLRETSRPPHLMYRTLSFVTGRGIHSANGQPRIKPAAKRRLHERGIDFIENNPGQLTARVCANHLLSNQVA